MRVVGLFSEHYLSICIVVYMVEIILILNMTTVERRNIMLLRYVANFL